MNPSAPSSRPLRLIPALAAAHLRHEWILTLCLVIALAAVIAPLLVLLGLKHGTIETLRERLVEDPVFREIRPALTREFAPEWFAEVADWPGVAFLTPTILPLSSVLQVSHPQRGGAEIFDLIPTAAGDPLLLENQVPIPVGDQVVLTTEAAQRLATRVGDSVLGRVTRSRGGRSEVVEVSLEVVGVLPLRAGSLARLYAPFPLVLDIEAYREGYGAPARDWPGDSPEPYLSMDGLVLLLPEPLPPIERTGLIINTGLARIVELDADGIVERLGWMPSGDWAAYGLFSPGTTVTVSSLRALEQKLRGRDRVLLPYISALELTETDSGQRLSPVGLSLDPASAQRLGLPALPWGGFSGRADAQRLNQMLWPAAASDTPQPHRNASGAVAAEPIPTGTRLEFGFDGIQALTFPLHVVGSSALPQPVVPLELLAVLRTGQQRALTYDRQTERFLMQRGGYRGFRLYARSIDDVPELYQRLRAQGLEVIAEVAAIERIQILDVGLGRLFWLIATLGFGGGVAVLVASLYAAVERRRRDLGVLRLVGFARRHVFFFPLAQGVIIAGLGLIMALLSYWGLAVTINRAFASELAPGEQFARLPPEYLLFAVVLTLGLALLSALAAAWRATHIDPAEAIRDQ